MPPLISSHPAFPPAPTSRRSAPTGCTRSSTMGIAFRSTGRARWCGSSPAAALTGLTANPHQRLRGETECAFLHARWRGGSVRAGRRCDLRRAPPSRDRQPGHALRASLHQLASLKGQPRPEQRDAQLSGLVHCRIATWLTSAAGHSRRIAHPRWQHRTITGHGPPRRLRTLHSALQ
jgi:hypothetical protein